MFVLHLILAAGSLSTLISGAPVPSFLSGVTQVTTTHLSEERRRSTSTYLTTFGGTGDVSDGWPSQDQWVSSFDTMFADNNAILKSSCTQWNVPNNSDEEISNLGDAIKSVSSSTGVDARFILAVVLQESNGCVRAPTTNYGVRNPGLMQDHNGAGTCNDATVQTPCPASEITQMIQDGVAGTAAGDGLKQCLALSGASDVSQYYKAARIYNSGSIDSSRNLGLGIATHCYASDIANRLLGWSAGPSSCDPGTVGTLSGTVGFVPSSGSDDVSVTIATTAPAAPTPTPEVVAAETPAVISGGAFLEATTAPAKAVETFAPEPTSTLEAAPVEPTVAPEPEVEAEPTPEPTPTPTPTPIAAPEPSSSPVEASTIIVVPTPAVSASPSSSPSPSSAPLPSTTPIALPSSSPIPSPPGAQTPGSACTSEGMWNCIGGTAFQQCASGVWSVVQGLAAGMQCKEGQSMIFGVGAIGRRR